MKKNSLALLVMAVIFLSCNRYIAPPFTDVSKISQLRKGMKLKQVQDVLEVEPYDIYHLQEENLSIAIFNYRLKKRVLKVPTLNRDEFERQTTNENSQTSGVLYYDKDYKVLFALLADGELTSFITSDGYKRSNKLIVSKNTINYATKNNTHLYDSAFIKSYKVLNLTKDMSIDEDDDSFFNNIFK